MAGYDSGFGWHVVLSHGDGYRTVYAHFGRPPAVRAGDEVAQGQALGFAGCTGRCTGAHIHFVLWKDNVSVPLEPICGLATIVVGQQLSNCAPLSTLSRPRADFTGDGFDDVAMFYGEKPDAARLEVLTSDGGRLELAEPEGWWHADAWYPLSHLKHALSGDFNGDGKTDVAALYDHPDCLSRMHVFLGTGDGFEPPDLDGWWQPDFYCADAVAHAVAGDFDGDARTDVALLYGTGPGSIRVDVLRSTGAGFELQEWWRADEGYWPARALSAHAGDFNGDGRTDLAALYDYGDCELRVHVFLSDAAVFEYQGSDGWSQLDGYCAEDVRHAASGDFDGDGAFDDLALLIDEGESRARIDVLLGDGKRLFEGAWWDEDAYYPAEGVRAVIPGDFNRDGRSDLAALFDYGGCFTRIHVFPSDGKRLSLNPNGWWLAAGYCAALAVPVVP
jgi:hypothetical protein